jgi:hypothetical protein
MRHQTPLALPPPAGTAHWGEQVLFSPNIVEALSSVNGAFIALAVELQSIRPGAPVLGLPGPVLAPLQRCPEAAFRLPLPYALFDLRFRDERFWKSETRAARGIQDGGRTPVADNRLLRFARSGLMLAWHLAQLDYRVARLALGVEPGTQEALESLPVAALDGFARRLAPAVSARFATRQRFWSRLVAALRMPTETARLERLKLLGLQLQGAESARVQQLHRRVRRIAQG